MSVRAIGSLLRRVWSRGAVKPVAVALLVYATGGPAVLSADNPLNFWIEQREHADQQRDRADQPKQKAQEAKPTRRPVRDFMPAEATRAHDAAANVAPSFFVDVIGDSLAISATDGLKDAFANQPEIAIVGRARDSSGLVRDDFYDWLKAARDLAAEKKGVDFVVIQIGINDLQAIRDGAENLDPLSDRWRDIYQHRIEAFLAPFKQAHIPVAWVGLPPMRNDRFNEQAAKLNELYKTGAEAAGAKYIDIWDAFADENGAYNAFGPDINGQNAKLRAVDGIHYTKAGARKAAQFLEADIRRVDDGAKPTTDIANLPPDIEQAATDINAQIRREMGASANPGAAIAPETMKPPAGPILSLTAKPVSPGGALAARSTAMIDATLAAGVEPDAKRGRADDFTWPPPQ